MKRRAALMLILVLLLTGCGSKTDGTQPSVSQRMRDAVQENWDAWNAMSKESQMLSSSTPGNCTQSFEDWASCEEYMELTVPNPLESCEWLEKGSYVGMPIGYADAPRVVLNWYGEEGGTIEKVSVTAGYRRNDVRVMLQADVYGEAVVVAAAYEVNTETADKYTAMRCDLVEDNILYRLNVVGEPGMQAQVEEVFAEVLALFPE